LRADLSRDGGIVSVALLTAGFAIALKTIAGTTPRSTANSVGNQNRESKEVTVIIAPKAKFTT